MSDDGNPSANPAPTLGGGCQVYDNLVICAPHGATFRTIRYCPTCKTRRRMVESWYVWYGPHASCTVCGDSWSDGERQPRPFARGWRKEAVAHAKREYAAAGTKREAQAAFNRELRAQR
jgi:hypothetical protein